MKILFLKFFNHRFVFVSLLFFSFHLKLFCQKNNVREKYLVTISNKKLEIKTIGNLSGDTLFLITKNGNTTVSFDSVIEYHSTRPGRGLRGFLIGAVSGITIGAVIGEASKPEPDNSNIYSIIIDPVTYSSYPIVGGLLGLVVGGGLGYLIGTSLEDDVHYDFSAMSKNKKKETLLNLIYK